MAEPLARVLGSSDGGFVPDQTNMSYITNTERTQENEAQKIKFWKQMECFPANNVGKVLMVGSRLKRLSFAVGYCTVFDGETPLDGIAVFVRGDTVYKTVVPKEEAAAWLLKHGCSRATTENLLEEALRRKQKVFSTKSLLA